MSHVHDVVKKDVNEKTVEQTKNETKQRIYNLIKSLDAKITAQEDHVMKTLSFRPNDAKKIIKHKYLNLLLTRFPHYPSFILIGHPGVGKSTIVKEAAMELANVLGKVFVDITDYRERERLYEVLSNCLKSSKSLEICAETVNAFIFMDLRLTELEPYDLTGIPRVLGESGNRTEYVPLTWAYLFAHLPGILFLDELSNVNRVDVMSAAYKLLLDRSAGFVKFNPHVMVIAAGNLPIHAPQIAKSLPPTIINRGSVLFVTAPTLDEWFEWMVKTIEEKVTEEGVRSEYLATLSLVRILLKNKPSLLLQMPTNYEGNENFPTPRSWSNFVFSTPISFITSILGNEPESKEAKDALLSYIGSFVGKEAAVELLSIILSAIKIDVASLIENPDKLDEVFGEAEAGEAFERALYIISILPEHLVKIAYEGTPNKINNAKKLIEKIYEYLKNETTLGENFAKSVVYSIHQNALKLATVLVKDALMLHQTFARLYDILSKFFAKKKESG